MTMMSDLPQDLEEEILSRVPITSLRAVRSTCKQWNRLFIDGSFIKNQRGKEFLAIKANGSKVCLMSINLHINQPIKPIGEIKLGYASRFIHCNGLLLSFPEEGMHNTTRLMVWNPYSGQTRRVEPRRAPPYGKQETYGFGYDKNNNHKILRLVCGLHEIYNLNSNSWKVHPSPSAILSRSTFETPSVSVKGSSYFLTKKIGVGNTFFLLGFDFTREAFGPRLELPYLSDGEEYPTLSALREEKLVVLLRRHFSYTLEMEIWITDKVEPNAVSWNKFFAFNFATTTCYKYMVYARRGFFVDEEKKVIMFSEMTEYGLNNETCGCIIGEDGYIKKVDLGEEFHSGGPFVCSYYAPSLVQI